MYLGNLLLSIDRLAYYSSRWDTHIHFPYGLADGHQYRIGCDELYFVVENRHSI